MNTPAQNRDELALERTRLANERTLLAYVRTSLATAAGGAAILHFYPDHGRLTVIAWSLVAASVFILGVGVYRFVTVRARLNR